MIVKARVLTNSEDDPHMRVKVQSEGVWSDESQLLSSLNSIYLEKDDIVLVYYDTLANPLILGKFNTFEQESPVEGQVLFSAKRDDSWIIGTIVNNCLRIQSSEGFIIDDFYKFLKIHTPDETELLVEDNHINISLAQGSKIDLSPNEFKIELKNGTTISCTDKISIKNSTFSLHTLLDTLLNTLSTTTPTTMGSPAAQNFNPTIIASLQNIKTQLFNLLQ